MIIPGTKKNESEFVRCNRRRAESVQRRRLGHVCGSWDGSNHLSTIDRFASPFDSVTVTHVWDLSGVRSEVAGCSNVDPHLRW